MKRMPWIAVAAMAASASASLATELYHSSNPEEGVTLRTDHMKAGLTRAQVEEGVLAAQRDGTLTWISRGYPARYPLVPAPALSNTRAQVERDLFDWKRGSGRLDGAKSAPGDPFAP